MVVTGTLKLHRDVAINMAPVSTFTMKLGSQKAREWVGYSCQSHGFNPSLLFSKLKSHVVRKREIYSKDRLK